MGNTANCVQGGTGGSRAARQLFGVQRTKLWAQFYLVTAARPPRGLTRPLSSPSRPGRRSSFWP
jgi:hypothetical protein